MKIDSIEIQNFKGLRDERFSPKSFSCLVGENNAGKSTVLQALVYALNRPKNIPASIFYDESLPIIFKVKFIDVLPEDLNRLPPEHITKMSPLIYGGELTITAKYKKADGLELLVSKLVPSQEKYRDESINENFRGMRSATQALNIIETTYPEFLENLPDGATPAQAKEHLKACINSLDAEQFEYVDTPLPSGIPSSISALLPEPIYIPAVKNFEDDLKTTQSTSFGRLIGLLMEDLMPDLQDINTTLVELKKRLNRYTDESGNLQDERLASVKTLEGTIEGFLAENFPNVQVNLEIPPPEIKTILNTAKIFIDDGSRDLIENKGDGVKRSLTFSLLRSYVEMLSGREQQAREQAVDAEEVKERPLVFLFEEPELYLHPKAQRVLFSTLAKISQSYQTIITTHSPIFFEPGVTAQFVRIAKEYADPKPIGRLYPVDFEIDRENLNTFRMAKYDHSEAAFFSNHIVLYEGESDDFFFRHVSKKLNPDWSFEDRNISLVEVGGKGNFSKFRSFFESFGLKVSILTDLDCLLDGFNHLGASIASNTLRSSLIQVLDRYIQNENIQPELTGRRVKRKVRNPRWVDKYETAKNIIAAISDENPITEEQRETLNSLFVWEEDEARYIALTSTNADIKTQLVSLLDSLRNEDIYVLSRGAIENYYPDEVSANLSKPERALEVASYVQTRETAARLSDPLATDRLTEFEEIFSSIFS